VAQFRRLSSTREKPATKTVEHSIEFRVRYAETDQMGVVYHSHYLVWCEIGRTDLMRSLGAPYSEIEKQGTGLAVVEANIRYHAGARYDDLVRVTTTVAEVRSRAVTFNYSISNAETGARFITASTTLAAITPGGKMTSIPQHLRELLENALT
jgi:acyl-CoA thioester hydrolase